MDVIYNISSKLFELYDYDPPAQMSIAEYNDALIHAQNEVFDAYSHIAHVPRDILMCAEHEMRHDADLYARRLQNSLRDSGVSDTDIAFIDECIAACINRMKLSGITIERPRKK